MPAEAKFFSEQLIIGHQVYPRIALITLHFDDLRQVRKMIQAPTELRANQWCHGLRLSVYRLRPTCYGTFLVSAATFNKLARLIDADTLKLPALA
jgi:hypothetical protein